MIKRREIWGKDPEFSGPRDWFRETLITRAIKRWKKVGRVLDFGSGSGHLLLRLAHEGFAGIGVDNSLPAVNYFRRQIQKKGLGTKLKALLGDEKTLFRLKERFDLIVAGETLEHLKDDKRAVAGFYRLLKKGGICVVTVPAHPWLWDVNDDFSGHQRRYEEADLRQPFEDAGFGIRTSFYWGFPLGLVWHKIFYLPLIRKKAAAKKKIIYSNPDNLFGRMMRDDRLKKIFSRVFYFDRLFNWTRLGGGLFLIAQKP